MPTDRALRFPDGSIVATDEALLDQTPPEVASVSVVDVLLHIVVMPPIAGGVAGTVFIVYVSMLYDEPQLFVSA